MCSMGNCGAIMYRWVSLHLRLIVPGFAAVFCGKFHRREQLPFFPAERSEHQNDCLALGQINKPMECSCS